jgi:hypothetical protein
MTAKEEEEEEDMERTIKQQVAKFNGVNCMPETSQHIVQYKVQKCW